MIASHPARLSSSGDLILIYFLLDHVKLDRLTQGACATIHHTDHIGQRERNVSLRRRFSMILSYTHISSQGLGRPIAMIFLAIACNRELDISICISQTPSSKYGWVIKKIWISIRGGVQTLILSNRQLPIKNYIIAEKITRNFLNSCERF